MNLTEQLDELWNTGRLVLDHPLATAAPSDEELSSWMTERERVYRLQLPEGPPELDLAWALWGCKQFVRASQLIVYRELGEEFLNSGLETLPQHLLSTGRLHCATEPVSGGAVSYVTDRKLHYSVDLFFRFVPDLNRLARAASGSDPLLQVFQSWAEVWPLSGVGISTTQVESEALKLIKGDIFLSTLYEDRKLLRQTTRT